MRRQNSVGGWNEEEKQEMDDALSDYVTDKLKRVRTSDSAHADDMTNELEVETHVDGHNDYFARKPNGHNRRNGHS
jgi:hypothetical protein